MDNVIQLDSKRPHVSGQAKCVACGHEWVAVARAITDHLECPSCRLMKGAFANPVTRSDLLYYICSCDSAVFYISEKGPHCANCGEWAPLTMED